MQLKQFKIYARDMNNPRGGLMEVTIKAKSETDGINIFRKTFDENRFQQIRIREIHIANQIK